MRPNMKVVRLEAKPGERMQWPFRDMAVGDSVVFLGGPTLRRHAANNAGGYSRPGEPHICIRTRTVQSGNSEPYLLAVMIDTRMPHHPLLDLPRAQTFVPMNDEQAEAYDAVVAAIEHLVRVLA